MKWEVANVDGSAIENKWHTGVLSSKLIAASNLDDEVIHELLDYDMTLTTSKAPCVLKACERILQAKENHEMVFVGGDYDADGICSTAIMKKTLDLLGIQNGYYIPDRFKEGYGLAAKTVEMAYQKGYRLIITVDNGVKAHEALRKARDLGMDVIVTDHHLIEEEIEADIVVHPDYMEAQYSYLSGAGVALEISRNLIGTGENTNDLIAICAVALIGDVMPLWKETRKIVKKGISILKMRKPASLNALFMPGSTIDETAIAFNIVPKLNSVGRMNDISNVNTVVKYLLLQDPSAISNYASQLNMVNERRKEVYAHDTEIAEKLIQGNDFEVLVHEDFHEGVCGLVAGKIANTIQKPVLVLAENGELLKGSGRSVPGFNMFSFFSDFEETAAFGGHEAAVGISVTKEMMPQFLRHIEEKCAVIDFEQEEVTKQAILVDQNDLNFDTIADLSILSPYPKDLVEPFFVIRNPEIIECKKTAKSIKYILQLNHQTLDAVIYKSRHIEIPSSIEGFVGKLGINRFRGKISLQMIIEDVL